MTDRHTAQQLQSAFNNANGPTTLDDWLAVARRARELFGPSVEERAVIENALELEASISESPKSATATFGPDASRLVRHFFVLVRALRLSRKPAPRYRVESWELSWQIIDSKSGNPVAYTSHGIPDSKAHAQRIADLLNAAEEGGDACVRQNAHH